MNTNVEFDKFFQTTAKAVKFNIGRLKSLNFVEIGSSIHDDTLTKLSEGLNHFLIYYAMRDYDEYNRICMHIWKTHNDIINDKKVLLTPELMHINQIPLIQKYCVLDPWIIHRIAKYVKDTVLCNIEEHKSRTNIALTNLQASLLTCIITASKLSFAYSQIIRGKMKVDDAIACYIEQLMHDIIYVSIDYFEDVDPEMKELRVQEMHGEIDTFLHGVSKKHWEHQDNGFRIKFEEIGQDTSYYCKKLKISVMGGFKKYVPQQIDEAKGKYNDPNSKEAIYYTIGKDPEDFKFAHKNLAAYISASTIEIINGQESKLTLIPSNVMDFLLDGSSERGNSNRDGSLYEDKLRYRTDAKKEATVDLFDMITKEVGTRFAHVKVDYVKEFDVSNSHLFNQMIINRCLLSLTGESKVYQAHLGVFQRVLLLLVYLSIKESPYLQFFNYYADIMRMEPVGEPFMTEDEVKAYLNKFPEFKETTPEAFRSCLVYYHSNNAQRVLRADELLDLMSYLSSPARVRHLLFPNKFSPIDEEEEPMEITDEIKEIFESVVH